jgi:hypothetical protein
MTIKKNNLNFLWKEIFFNRKLVLVSLLFSVLIVSYISINQPHRISLELRVKSFPAEIGDIYFDVYRDQFLNNKNIDLNSKARNYILESEIAKNILTKNENIYITKIEEIFAQKKNILISELKEIDLITNSLKLSFSKNKSYFNLDLNLYKELQKNINPFKIQPKLKINVNRIKVYILKFLNEDMGFNNKIDNFYFEDIKSSQKTKIFKYLSSIIFLFLLINFIYAVIKFRKKIFI